MSNLALGMRGAAVSRWQKFLGLLGYGVVVDGVFGPKTEAATKLWQSSVGLVADGVVGPVSLARAFPERGFVDVRLLWPVFDREGRQVGRLRFDAAESYNRMVLAAAEGVDLRPTSSADTYRGPGVYASAEARRKVRAGVMAAPGRSRHNQGIAVDFRDTAGAYRWLREKGGRFGWWLG